jgi:hypothetical protein
MIRASIALHFPKGYIAEPYWPERAQLIDIQKGSGLNRARSEANRRKALEEFLKRQGMTLSDYEALEKRAARPFYTNGSDEIIIPETQILSFLVATCDEVRSASRPCDPQQVRSRFIATDMPTGKTQADGIWQRFVTVSSGTGAKLSNQRGLRKSAYIADFSTSGTLTFDEGFVDPATLRSALEWGGNFMGLGAARKMGWGRFALTDFRPEKIA